MGYTNSSLVNYVKLSPNHSGQRTHSIDYITPHCVVGQCSVETLGNIFLPVSKDASCNYAIGSDGRVLLCVEEKNRSWCSSSNANDQRAVTIECASDAYHPYAFKDVVYNKLIDLCVDICRRNGKSKLLWFGDKNKTLNYNPRSDEMMLSVHRWFANKSCPGDWMYSRMGDLATKVTARLNGGSVPVRDKNLYQGVLPYPVLSIGDYGIEVEHLQSFLNWFGNYGLDVDGSFGSLTENALKDFQKYSNIDVDGIYGNDSYNAADKAKKKSATPTPTPQPVTDYYTGSLPSITLYKGDSGTQVKYLQQFLNWYGNYKLDVDGVFGLLTYNAVKDFQKNMRIEVDGIFGFNSRSVAKTAKKKTKRIYSGTIPTAILSVGKTGDQVRMLQQFLNWFGNYGLMTDGIFGNLTASALRKFQSAEGIDVDGIYGEQSKKAAQSYK